MESSKSQFSRLLAAMSPLSPKSPPKVIQTTGTGVPAPTIDVSGPGANSPPHSKDTPIDNEYVLSAEYLKKKLIVVHQSAISWRKFSFGLSSQF